MQNSQANCAPTAVKNALCALGIERSVEECEVLCGCTATDGTPPKKLYKGLETIHELDPVIISESREEIALVLLEQALRDGRPVIMLVDAAEHWVTAFGLLGKRVQIADGADSELVISSPISAMASRWKNPHSKRAPFYGIIT
jgi:hypothetical protein